MKNDLNVVLQKPEPFIAPESQVPVSNDEIEKRKRMIARLEQIGEKPTRVTDNEYENPYKLEAIALIAEDKEVPEELMKKIEGFERTREGKNTASVDV